MRNSLVVLAMVKLLANTARADVPAESHGLLAWREASDIVIARRAADGSVARVATLPADGDQPSAPDLLWDGNAGHLAWAVVQSKGVVVEHVQLAADGTPGASSEIDAAPLTATARPRLVIEGNRVAAHFPPPATGGSGSGSVATTDSSATDDLAYAGLVVLDVVVLVAYVVVVVAAEVIAGVEEIGGCSIGALHGGQACPSMIAGCALAAALLIRRRRRAV